MAVDVIVGFVIWTAMALCLGVIIGRVIKGNSVDREWAMCVESDRLDDKAERERMYREAREDVAWDGHRSTDDERERFARWQAEYRDRMNGIDC